MHELGLVYQVVKTVDEVVKKNGLAEVDEIVLQVGEMSDVVPKFLEEAWAAAAPTTDYPSAKMAVEVMPALAKCLSCGYEGHVKTFAPYKTQTIYKKADYQKGYLRASFYFSAILQQFL